MRRCVRVLSAAWLLVWGAFSVPSAHAAAPGLTCAVEGMSRGIRSKELCQALAAQFGRGVSMVADAREVQRGDAVQIITGDVAWTVVWLVDGHVRTWTRVSKIDPIEEQVKLLARAARELSKQAKDVERPDNCLRIDPNGGHKLRSSDLTYPWAELQPCKRKSVEVVDPWWLPALK